MKKEETLAITIDNQRFYVSPGMTILQAARQNGIYIPSLCALESLPSYGACRLCVVEVDGIRGFPTSCTTPVEDGMVIRTDTAEIRTLRQEVLRLLLSEHPASCLFCGEQSKCREYMGTIRKVGVTTGCRYCPNDNRCELQVITEKIGLTETSYPVLYRGFPVEKFDPFYDRDYNLCLLCGRCIRVCNDIRLNGTLTFKQRGKLTTIGPAFDRTHLEAGCEFCGACVSVCPTGVLSTKASKWYGKPDAEVPSTCTFCPIGCTLILHTKNNEVVDALPDYNSPIDHGLICVKGRFAIPEYVNSVKRLPTPKRLTPIGYQDISWDEAIGIAADRLKNIEPDDFLMVVSSQLSNEDLFEAQLFIRKVMNSENIISLPMIEIGNGLAAFLELASHASSLDAIDEAGCILTIGFDSTYGYSPIGIKAKKAVLNGSASLITINPYETNLDMYAEVAINIDPSVWPLLFDIILDFLSKGSTDRQSPAGEDIITAAKLLNKGGPIVMIVGPQAIPNPEGKGLFERLMLLRDSHAWKVIVAHPYTNLNGMLAMGCFPSLQPGAAIEVGDKADGQSPAKATINLSSINLKGRKKVIYLLGEVPLDCLPECDFLIYENGLATESGRRPDLILPSILFTETDGTLISGERHLLKINKAAETNVDSRPDWWVIGKITEKMGVGNHRDLADLKREMEGSVGGILNLDRPFKFVRIDVNGILEAPSARGVFMPYTYRGIQLSDVVPGMKVIEEHMMANICGEKEGQ